MHLGDVVWVGSADVFAALSNRAEISVRLLVALALTWVLGFERELRGSAAGDRTFSLVGLGSAVVGYLALNGAPNALAGVLTGIGFIGAGVIIHGGTMAGDATSWPGRTSDPPEPDHGGDKVASDRSLAVTGASTMGDMGMVRGVTTAATIYLAAAVGAAAGQGQLLLAALATAASLLLLEVRHVRALRVLDGRYWRNRTGDADRPDT